MATQRFDRVDYYANLINGPDLTDDEWLSLQIEVENWFNSATIEEQEAFTESGCSEILSMICSGIGKNE